MNYILHLNQSFQKFCQDEKLTPFHISLYFALFQYWNMAKFRNPISISRDELMKASKIGSVNTYIRCMKELDTWKYIQYKPSFNPQKGSQVYLYSFDKATNKGTDNAGSNADETQVIPYINSKNNTNKLNSKKEYAHTRTKNNQQSFVVDSQQRKKVASKKESRKPTIAEIENYFTEQKSSALEAKKFFNHYQSNGWLVGKVPMKNWQASAEKWILNADKFGSTKSKLHVATNKNYDEPL